MLQGLINVNAAIMIIFLLIMTNSEIIMRLSIGRVFQYSMLIVIYGLLQDSNRVVGICEVLIENIMMPIPETPLQEGNTLRVPSQVIQGS